MEAIHHAAPGYRGLPMARAKILGHTWAVNPGRGRAVSRAKKFEVAVYNKDVRQLVKEGERHRHLTDDWADIHYVDVMAEDEREARLKAEAKYPEDKGFVIENVSVSNDPS